MVICTGRVVELAPWPDGPGEPGETSRGRLLCEPAVFLAGYRAGRMWLIRHLVTAALAVWATSAPGPG